MLSPWESRQFYWGPCPTTRCLGSHECGLPLRPVSTLILCLLQWPSLSPMTHLEGNEQILSRTATDGPRPTSGDSVKVSHLVENMKDALYTSSPKLWSEKLTTWFYFTFKAPQTNPASRLSELPGLSKKVSYHHTPIGNPGLPSWPQFNFLDPAHSNRLPRVLI